MRNSIGITAAFLLLILLPAGGLAQDSDKKLSQQQAQELLEEIDARQASVQDYKAQVYLEQSDKDSKLLYEVAVYRRDKDDHMMLLFLKPKADAGTGYLMTGDNMFFYAPGVGKWERRTVREKIGGTDSRHRDFGSWEFANRYEPSFKGIEKLGKFSAYHLRLEAKEDVDVAFPIVELWVDSDSRNVLKMQSFSLSGKLLRSSYYPKWMKVKHESTGEMVYVPKEIRHYDEVDKDRQSLMVIKSVSLKALPDNIFTKAWLESKSR